MLSLVNTVIVIQSSNQCPSFIPSLLEDNEQTAPNAQRLQAVYNEYITRVSIVIKAARQLLHHTYSICKGVH